MVNLTQLFFLTIIFIPTCSLSFQFGESLFLNCCLPHLILSGKEGYALAQHSFIKSVQLESDVSYVQ